MPAPEAALAIGIRQLLAARQQQRSGRQHIAVTPCKTVVVRRNIRFDPHAAVFHRHHAVDAEQLLLFGGSQRPPADTHERRRDEFFHVEIAGIHGRYGARRFGQRRSERQRIRLHDAGAVTSRVVFDHRNRLRRTEELGLRPHNHQMRPYTTRIPPDRGYRHRILRTLRRNRDRQPCKQ